MQAEEEDAPTLQMRRAASSPWMESDVGKLHKDQSYLGRPIDPETVSRVRHALNQYTGPRTLADHLAIQMKKADEKRRENAKAAAEYAAKIQKVKDEAVPVFKFEDDPRKGMPTQDEYIKTRVKAGLRDIREKTNSYNSWVEDLKTKQAYKLEQKLAEKAEADAAFNAGGKEREAALKARNAEIAAQVAATQQEYWNWLKGMKDEVAARPNSAPPPRADVQQAFEAAATKRKAEMTKQMQTQRQEYNTWLESVKNPKFALPYVPPDYEGLRKKQEVAHEKKKEFHKASNAYFDNIKAMEKKHHARIMRVVEKRLEADRKFNEDHAAAAVSLAAKMEEEKQRQAEVAAKSRQETRDMYKRVKDKPMFLELAYKTKI